MLGYGKIDLRSVYATYHACIGIAGFYGMFQAK